MQTIQQRLRGIRRISRIGQVFAAIWSLFEIMFIVLAVTTREADMVVSHVCAFAVAALMMWLMATAARVFQQNILQAALKAHRTGFEEREQE